MSQFKLNLFEIFSLTWISVAIFALLFALLGIFSKVTILVGFIFVLVFLIILYRKGTLEFAKPSKRSLLALITLLVVGILLSYLTTPTIFGGRDEGSYSNAAILLTNQHQLTFQGPVISEFFHIYGPGKALNFPGFYYSADGGLKSQFLPGFISWIATLYALFGLKGLGFTNLLPFITFLFSYFYILKKLLLGKQFLKRNPAIDKKENLQIQKYALVGFFLLLSCFPLILFYKFTLSEIFFASLIWFTFYLILKYFEHKSFAHYLLIFIPFSLMLFTRIESLGFVFILFFLFVLKDFNHIRQAKYQFVYALLALVMVISLIQSSNFFVDTAKNILEPFFKKSPAADSGFLSDDLMNFYLPKVLFTYNILPLIVLGGVYIIYLLKKKQLRLLIPFFFFLPTLIYLVDANISLDHPWMLRRFLFSIIPLFILYATLFLYDLSQRAFWPFNFKFISSIIVILMGIINLLLLFPNFNPGLNFVTYSQNPTLLEQTRQIKDLFGNNDLILVSRKSSGSGWSLISEPLRNVYGKKAVYFFNPNDLEKIDLAKFDNVYLITSHEELPLYENLPMQPVKDYTISNSFILPSRNPSEEASISQYQAKGTIYKIEK